VLELVEEDPTVLILQPVEELVKEGVLELEQVLEVSVCCV
jgi:hypothetical protein